MLITSSSTIRKTFTYAVYLKMLHFVVTAGDAPERLRDWHEKSSREEAKGQVSECRREVASSRQPQQTLTYARLLHIFHSKCAREGVNRQRRVVNRSVGLSADSNNKRCHILDSFYSPVSNTTFISQFQRRRQPYEDDLEEESVTIINELLAFR